ncbi:hypothetical protein SOVF_005000 [Spinacia oleracea]|nr:hypothetical protein SOVF_005000 [Spinacia oleracea]
MTTLESKQLRELNDAVNSSSFKGVERYNWRHLCSRFCNA